MKLTSNGIADPVKALGQCLIQSGAYAKKHNLGLIRVTGYEYSGREHWAVYIYQGEPEWGDVIDLTARQFSTKVPARYETDCTTWLDDACEWLGDSVNYEIYLTHDSQAEPFYSNSWIREDIDPDNYQREYAGFNQLKEKRTA